MNDNMNILYVTCVDPRLTNSGTEQRTNLLWESLKRHGNVYTYLMSYNVDSESEMIEGDHPIYKFHLVRHRSSLWQIINLVLSKLSLFSIYDRKMIEIKSPEMVFGGVHFDVVVSRYIYPLCNYKFWEIAPLIIDIDDHPFQIFETVRKKRLPFGLKWIGSIITKWQTKIIMNKSAGGWIANIEQLNLCGDNYEYLQNIPHIPSKKYEYNFRGRKNLFTVGLMGYIPNKEGVTSFLTQIWPSFHEKYPDVKYYIVGKKAPEADLKFWNSFDGVKYLGFVEDLEALYEKTLATIVPVYSGGGTCIKTLESMAYSRPCLSTIFGVRGLPVDAVENERGVLVFSNPNTFISAYEKLLDLSSRERIERRGRELISDQYSIDSFNKAVEKILFR